MQSVMPRQSHGIALTPFCAGIAPRVGVESRACGRPFRLYLLFKAAQGVQPARRVKGASHRASRGMNEESVTRQKRPGATSLSPRLSRCLATRLKACAVWPLTGEAAPKSRNSTDGKEQS